MTDAGARAEILDRAALDARPVPQLPPGESLSVEAAHAIQARLVARRLERGERPVGLKLGLTSAAKMKQVGVTKLILGRVIEAMQHDQGGTIDLGALIHPRVESEIAFLLRCPLPPDPTPEQALHCVEAVAPALEIIDSRYEGFRLDLGDVAYNATSAGFILGRWHPPDTDSGNVPIVLSLSGVPRETGTTAAILGHPLNALAAAGRIAASRGVATAAGDVVLAGAATAVIALSHSTRVASHSAPSAASRSARASRQLPEP